MTPQVSFIVPCYNEIEHIENCIISIYQQKVAKEKFEVLVVDNGSSDGTRERAASLGAKVLINKKKGAAASRNMGARYAQGSLLAFVDADCLLDPMWLYNLSAHLAIPNVAAAAAPAVPALDGISWVEQAWSKVFVCPKRISQNGVIRVSNLASSNMLINKEYFETTGGFDEMLLSCEDYDLSCRLLLHGELLLDENIYVTHLRESKTISELFRREIGRGRFSLRCYAKNGYSYRELPSTLIPFLFGFIFVAILIALSLAKYGISLLIMMFLLIIPIIYLARGGFRFAGTKSTLQEYIISSTYVAARSISLVHELLDIFSSNMKMDRR
jgi:glycosyltransferase involved in cell wall biosynthesis